MKMKKTLSVLLTSVMLLSSVNFVYAENTDTAVDAVTIKAEVQPLNTEEFQALYAMGIVGEEMTAASSETLITRAQFAGYLFRLAGYSVVEHGTADIPFKDVSLETPYYNEICTLCEMGIVNGTEPDRFSPDACVTYAQACKMISDVLGYRNYATIKYGGYPENYILMAGELEINDGVKNAKANAELSAEDAMTMLYNAGFAEVMTFSGTDINGNPIYKTSGKNLFAETDIYFAEGIMESNGIVSLVDVEAPENVTIISGKSYTSADTDLTDLLGFKVKYFYRDTDVEKKLLWAFENKIFNSYIDIKAYDLAIDAPSYSMTNVVYYDEDGDKENLKIDSLASVIYNNSLCDIPSEDIFKIKNGKMRLIDINDDDVYDTVIIEEFFNIFVNNVVATTNHISDKYNNTLDLKKYDVVKIIKDGKEVEFSKVAANTVLSCIENKEKTKIYIYIINEKGKSALKSVGSVRNRYVYNFADGSYRLSNQYDAMIKAYEASMATPDPSATATPETTVAPYVVNPKPGKTYTYYLDMAGEIAEIEDPKTDLQYALMMSVKPGADYEDGVVYTRYLMADGGKVSGITKKKVILNGTRTNSTDILTLSALYDDQGAFKPQVVQVAFDEEGYLKELNTALDCTDATAYPYGYNANEFSLDYSGSKYMRVSDGFFMVDYRYLISSEAVIFFKWNNLNDPEPYAVTTRASLSMSGSIPMELYDVTSDLTATIAYMPTYFNSDAYWMSGRMIVDNTDVIFEDGQELRRVSGYISGEYKSVTEKEPGVIPTDLQKGDIIRISHYSNKATKINVEIQVEEFKNKTPRVMSGNSPDAMEAARFVPIYNVSNLGLTTINPDEWSASYGKINIAGFKSGYKLLVLIYNSETGEVSAGDIHDLYQIYTPNADGSLPDEEDIIMAYVNTRYSALQEVIIVL